MSEAAVPFSVPPELSARLAVLRRRLRFLFVCTAIGAAIGVAAALLLPAWFTSRASFQPESQLPSFLSGGLAGLASQLGAGALGSQANPQFYADLLRSDIVTRRLAEATFETRNGQRPLYEIYGYERLAGEKRIQRTALRLAKSIDASVNIRTGVVSFTVSGRSPQMAKALADSVLAIVNDFNVSIRQTRAAHEHDFSVGRAREAELALSRAEAELAQFNMRNRVISSPLLQAELDQLRRAADIASQVYLQLRLQAEQAAVQQVRNTPALTVIEAPQLPIRQSWPNRRVTVVVATLAGLLFALGYLMLRPLAPQVTPGGGA